MAIERLPSGSYRITISGGRIPGTNRYRKLRKTLPAGSTRAEIARAELALRVEAEDTTIDGDMMTTAQLCAAWIDNASTTRQPKTLIEYRRLVNNWVAPHDLGAMACSRVRTPHVEAHYRNMLQATGVSTVRHTHSVLRGAFKWATAMGWIAANPVTNTTPLPAQKRTVTATDPTAWANAIERGDSIRPGLSALLLFVGTTGVRKGEALALRWCDIDGGRAHIRRTVSDLPGGSVVKPATKTGEDRTVPISARTGAALDKIRQAQMSAALAMPGFTFTDDGYVWSVDDVGVLHWRGDTAGKWAAKAGVKFGQLRHMVATELLAAGVPVHEVSHMLGHASVKMTLDVYGQPLGNHGERMVSTMESLSTVIAPIYGENA